MSDQISSNLYNIESDINVYQPEYQKVKLSLKQIKDICPQCGNDHSFKESYTKSRTSFDIFQEVIDDYNRKHELENKNQKVVINV